jgi:hypothetical protein
MDHTKAIVFISSCIDGCTICHGVDPENTINAVTVHLEEFSTA